MAWFIVNVSGRSGYGESNFKADAIIEAADEDGAFEKLGEHLRKTVRPRETTRDEKRSWAVHGSHADHYYTVQKATIVT